MSTRRTGSREKKTGLKIGIIGCGAIGTNVAMSIDRGMMRGVRVVALSDRNQERAKVLSRRLRSHPPVLDMNGVITYSDLVVESAHRSVVPELLKKIVQRGKSLLVMSTGGLIGQERLLEAARKRRCLIAIPSGALLGIDGVKAAAFLPIRKVVLTTRKPPRSFEGAPFVLRNRIRLGGIRRERLLFRGNVKQAVKEFPQNINVAATLGLAGVDPRRFEVRIIADPRSKRNSHEVTVVGPLGKFSVRCENVPSKENPKTSRLAIFSALATLKALLDPVRVGT